MKNMSEITLKENKTKVCKCCGKELPISEFRKGKASGVEFVVSVCKTCMRNKLIEGHAKRKEQKSHEQELAEAKVMRLSDFTPRELMVELKRRGYEFKMEYTETHIINSKDIEI